MKYIGITVLLILSFSTFAKKQIYHGENGLDCKPGSSDYRTKCFCDTERNDYFEYEEKMHCLPHCGEGLERVGMGCVGACNGARNEQGACYSCPETLDSVNGKCVLPCAQNQERIGEACVAACTSGSERWDGACVATCTPDEFRNPKGKCKKFKKCKPREATFGKHKGSGELERISYSDDSSERAAQVQSYKDSFEEVICKKECSLGFEMLNNGKCVRACSPGLERVGNNCKPNCPQKHKRDRETGQCYFCQD